MFRLALQFRQACVPELAEKLHEFRKAFRSRSVEPPCALSALREEPRFAKNPEVLGNRRTRQVELRCDLSDAQLLVPDESKDVAATRLRNHLENVHRIYLSTDLGKR